jgi:hypothetical protein
VALKTTLVPEIIAVELKNDVKFPDPPGMGVLVSAIFQIDEAAAVVHSHDTLIATRQSLILSLRPTKVEHVYDNGNLAAPA